MKNQYAWVDIETTGLDETDTILEIAIVATDKDLNVNYGIKNIIDHDFNTPPFLQMSNFVIDMHTKNGLLQDLKKDFEIKTNMQQSEDLLLKWMIDKFGDSKPPLCGCSPHFDRAFLKRLMPRLESRFHYRNIDVSTVRRLCRDWFPEVPEYLKGDVHRAYPDCRDAITELAYYKMHMKGK